MNLCKSDKSFEMVSLSYMLIVVLIIVMLSETAVQQISNQNPPHHRPQIFRRGRQIVRGSPSPFQRRDSTGSSETASDINYRALATNHYRNFYRNRNYFVEKEKDINNIDLNTNTFVSPQQVDRSTTVGHYAFLSTKSPSVLSQFTPRSVATTTEKPKITSTSSSAVHFDDNFHLKDGGQTMSSGDYGINDPILFEDATPYSAYIRPLEPVDVHSSVENSVASAKNKSKPGAKPSTGFQPTLDGASPPCAQDAIYCEKLDNYPEKILNEVLQRSITPQEFQKVYGDTTDNSTKVTDLKAVFQRTGLGPVVEETPLCSAVEHTIYPKVAKSKDNKWMFVVNHDEYIQGVRIEKCLDEGQSCFYGEVAPMGYQTACRQKYIYKKLLALTPEGKTSSESFKLPSCCACYVKTASLTDRFLGTKSSDNSRLTPKTPSNSRPNTESYDIDFQDEGGGSTQENKTSEMVDASTLQTSHDD